MSNTSDTTPVYRAKTCSPSPSLTSQLRSVKPCPPFPYIGHATISRCLRLRVYSSERGQKSFVQPELFRHHSSILGEKFLLSPLLLPKYQSLKPSSPTQYIGHATSSLYLHLKIQNSETEEKFSTQPEYFPHQSSIWGENNFCSNLPSLQSNNPSNPVRLLHTFISTKFNIITLIVQLEHEVISCFLTHQTIRLV